MSLMDRPSPNPRLITPDPKRWGQRYDTAQREAHKATVRAHALAAGHPCAPYDYEAEDHWTILLGMSPAMVARIRTLLRQTHLDEDAQYEAEIRRQLHGSRVVDPDWTPADGIPRGTA